MVMKLIDIIKANSKILEAKLESSKLYEHNGMKGTCREEDLINIIRDCLPECYGLKPGQIFSQHDQMSNQIDVVIYDSIFSNYFKRDSSAYLFPAESVYGTIEVKSMLNKEAFDMSIDNIKSVRRLKREDSTLLDLTPTSHLDLSPKTFKYNKNRFNEYLNIIFAYDSVSVDTLNEYIRKLNEDFEMLPTFIYVYKKEVLYVKVEEKDNHHYIGMNHEKNTVYTLGNYKDNSLTVFFLMINAMLEQIKLKSIDYSKFLNDNLGNLRYGSEEIIDRNIPNNSNF